MIHALAVVYQYIYSYSTSISIGFCDSHIQAAKTSKLRRAYSQKLNVTSPISRCSPSQQLTRLIKSVAMGYSTLPDHNAYKGGEYINIPTHQTLVNAALIEF